MKKLNDNIRLGIYEAVAVVLGILAFVFTFIPAYFEDGQADMSIYQIMVGNDRIAASGLLIFAFVILILGVLTAAALTALHFLNKTNPVITTVLSVVSIVLMLAGGAILTASIFISGLDKLNSELGLVQGSWGFKAGNFLVPVFTLLAVGFSYPSALVIPHSQDLRDKK